MLQPAVCVYGIDHLVLTVADIPTTLTFYRDILGMQATEFQARDGSRRWALTFGEMKINLHQHGAEFAPKANHHTPGSADLCFLTKAPLADWHAHLARHRIPVLEGPVVRTGATGPLMSIYVRDPDQNLIEIAVAD